MARRSSDALALPVSSGFVDEVYRRLSPVYDLLFGRMLQPGRVAAVSRIVGAPGTRVLEVGVGTGLNASLYPTDYQVTGIDFSEAMLEKAQKRVAREHLRHIRLLRMDAAHLAFPDHSFEYVYAPYIISVVPEPVQVAREMRRVCKPGGTVLFLNHFRSTKPWIARIERAISPFTMHMGFRSDLDLGALLAGANLQPRSIVSVNDPPIWRLVCCLKDKG